MPLDGNQTPNDNRILGYPVQGGRPITDDILKFNAIQNIWTFVQDETGDITGGFSLGAGEIVFASEIAGILNFKSITASADVLLTGTPDEIAIALSVAFLARIAAIEADFANYQLLAEKDAASGYAGLSAGSKIAASQIQQVIALGDLTDMPAPTADLFLKRNAGDTAYEFAAAGGGITESTNLTVNGITLTMGQWVFV